MRRVIIAELRDSWSAWLGVSLGFVMTGFAFTLAALVLQSGLGAAGVIPAEEATVYASQAGTNLVLTAVVGLSVVAASTALVIDSRRGAVARLALAGATPGNVVTAILTQLTVVALASAVVGDLLAVALLRPTLDYLQAGRGADTAGIPVPGVVEPGTVVGVNLVWILVVLIGGYRQARRGSHIPPVEALRQAQGLPVRRSGAVGRVVRVMIALAIIAGMFAAVPLLTANENSETFSQIMQLNMFGLVIVGWLFAELMPWVVRPVTAGWTRLVPTGGSPTWTIARATVLARSQRLAQSATPVMFTVGLGFGVLTLPASYNAIFAASGIDVTLEHVGAETFLALLGLALLVALCGSVGSLFMMSRQREAELALLGVSGATPRQRVATATLEAVIITGTASLLGLVMVGVSVAHLAWATPMTRQTFALDVPVGALAVAVLVAGGITVAATVLPTLRTLGAPEPKVIARLVAE